jgi:hypothetical protein
MKNKLRVRRLTLALASRSEDAEGSLGDREANEILDKERLFRSMEVAASSRNRTMHRVHGVEDRIGYRFWARESDPGSESEDGGGVEEEVEQSSVETSSTEVFLQHAQDAGSTIQKPQQAEDEIHVSPRNNESSAPKGSHAKQIVDELARKNKHAPWTGPLPAPRKSPRRTIGYVIAKAKAKVRPLSNRAYGSPRSAQPSSSYRSSTTGYQRPIPDPGIRIGAESWEWVCMAQFRFKFDFKFEFKPEGSSTVWAE